ncbi:hypothetical protein GCM10011391_21290 [Pullulanibacillus camelliae]|uniref:Asp/Glu/hydantoin racemase n=1 Tax=Pullulanibacillus camelliae TaxID=1707096 RepID=A0A8J2YEA5_9BACL|nr:aspartate/glutamate racemase family protein [Pullulanibacillus camelliae]GGE42234.1 hypothetical protein GCM10011391_21290 [Pullulanibacillus camelliae]
MSYRIGLVHATLNAVEPMNAAFRKYAPNVECLNFLDEGLIKALNETGQITPEMIQRLEDLVHKAEASGVDGVLLTCSSFTPQARLVQSKFDMPVLSVDLAMLEQAVEMGHYIGLIATVAAAGPTSEKILIELAEEKGKEISVVTEVVTEAFKALNQGNTAQHDALIQDKIAELSGHCDVIVLAQISMIRALEADRAYPKPVLTSPEISIAAILSALDKRSS